MSCATDTDPRDSEERAMLREAAARYVERGCTFESRRAALALPEGFSRERWRAVTAAA